MGQASMRPRIVTADEYAVMLIGIAEVLGKEFQIAGTATNGRDLVDVCARISPHAVILDPLLPELGGFTTAQIIKRMLPQTHLIFFTRDADPLMLRHAVRYGASACVLKNDAPEELLKTTKDVLTGRSYVAPHFGEQELNGTFDHGRSACDAPDELSERQRQIINLISEGRPSKQIADFLGLSVRTVDFHRQRLMDRLGVHSIAQLVRRGIEEGYIPCSANVNESVACFERRDESSMSNPYAKLAWGDKERRF